MWGLARAREDDEGAVEGEVGMGAFPSPETTSNR